MNTNMTKSSWLAFTDLTLIREPGPVAGYAALIIPTCFLDWGASNCKSLELYGLSSLST